MVSEEGLTLTPVRRNGCDHSICFDQVQFAESFAQLARLGVAQPHPVADLQPVSGCTEQRRLYLARALLTIQPEPGREVRGRQPRPVTTRRPGLRTTGSAKNAAGVPRKPR